MYRITVQYFEQLSVHVIINNHVLFCDPNPTCFGSYRPSSEMSFTKEYISYIPLPSSVMTTLKMAHRGRNKHHKMTNIYLWLRVQLVGLNTIESIYCTEYGYG
jgi:hypothetical protein